MRTQTDGGGEILVLIDAGGSAPPLHSFHPEHTETTMRPFRFYDLCITIVTAAAIISARPSLAQTGGCASPNAQSTRGVDWLKLLVTSTRPSAIAQRNLAHITATSASDVSLVTADSVCTAVGEARANDQGLPWDGAPIFVYKVGSLYVADDATIPADPQKIFWQATPIFDAQYNYVGIIGR